MRRVAPYILTLLMGVVIGGFLFSKSIKRSLLAVQSCDEECLQPKDLAGLLGSLGIQHAPTLLPFYEAQSKECIAVRHPKPEGRFHLVFLPPLPGKMTPLQPDHVQPPGGLMEQSNASLQRDGQS